MPEKDSPEIQLLTRLVKKEQSAWKELYNSYSRELTSICRRYLKGNDDIHDILQNSFIKMFHHIDSFKYMGKGSLKAWIIRIVINEVLQYIRSFSKMEFSTMEEEMIGKEDDEEPELSDVPMEELMTMIKLLPDGYRVVFNLYVFENKSHKEISQLLSISEGSSASQLHKAKRKLVHEINTYKQFKKEAL
ncbi:RNA polymerase sigma factor [Chryseobacterium vrystaatense]|uniref:RNA polymerase sigma-70 factor, ECF subfamily n=1 Tax=Chryseobacterium vrystaatense TaxID=307480 RepID=A0A1M4UTV3_9FLAO|nr:RNA polymerase sigma factor [Chryseobacterium vrystaatense]SHE60181.1 RNA polymerase sigma-70 factor, ECF subfamily [Chryseobacterium vrystaatense]